MQYYPHRGFWGWWQRLFSLPFNTTFDAAGVQPVTITHLQENSTYDVFCWAIDALGNDIAQELVLLELPFGRLFAPVATEVGSGGTDGRRLGERDEEVGLKCTEKVREYLPCEEKIVTTDRKPPIIRSGRLGSLVKSALGAAIGADREASWEMELQDPSCIARPFTVVKCFVRCTLSETKVALPKWTLIDECHFPACAEERWSNDIPVILHFLYIRAGTDYSLLCRVKDPWGNAQTQQFSFHSPASTSTTMAAWPSTAPEEPEEIVTSSSTRPPPRWNPQPSVPIADDDERWVVIGDQRTTTRRSDYTPRTSNPAWSPVWATVESTTSPWTPRPVRTSPPTTTEAPFTLPPHDDTPPAPVRVVLSLGTASKADVQVLQRPAAVAALVAALRSVLVLSNDDTITMFGVRVVEAPAVGGRRLEGHIVDSEGGASPWALQVEFEVRMVGKAHAHAVQDLLDKLASSASVAIGVPLRKELGEAVHGELVSRGISTEVTVGLAVVHEGQEAGANGLQHTPHTTDVPRNAAPIGMEEPARRQPPPSGRPRAASNSWAVPVVVAAAFLLLACVFMGAVCGLRLL